jgi:hypothetical protein
VVARSPDLPEARVARAIGGLPVEGQLRWEASNRSWALISLVVRQARLEEPRGAMPVLNDELKGPQQGLAVPIQVESAAAAAAVRGKR